MIEQYVNFSYALPVKFYKNTTTPGAHLDDDWAYSRILSFQQARRYSQRWQIGDLTKLQITSTILPDTLKIYNCKKVLLGEIAWVEVLTWTGFKVYELVLNLDAYPGEVYLYQRVALMDTVFEAISEPIEVRATWKNTAIFEYYNSYDNFDVFFNTGVKFRFRVEAGLLDYEPNSDSSDFIDETRNTELLSSTPYDQFQLAIGDAAGVPDWTLKILNFIVNCDNWKLEIKPGDKKQYVKSGKWDISRQKGWAMYGATIDVTPAENAYSLQMNALTVDPGIVTGYTLGTNFFGTSVSQINVEQINITE